MLLKNVVGEDVGWQLWPKKRLIQHTELYAIKKYFEPKFNAVTENEIVFQQPARIA